MLHENLNAHEQSDSDESPEDLEKSTGIFSSVSRVSFLRQWRKMDRCN